MKLSENVQVLKVVGKQVYYPVLLKDEGNLVLVDAGYPLDFELLKAEISACGFQLKDINKIIITHQDLDHIGCLKEILLVSPDIEVMCFVDEEPYITGELPPVKLAKMDRDNPFYTHFKAGFDNRRLKIDRVLYPNDVLPICGGVQVLHTPGHTPGHMALYVIKDKIMICGDALRIVGDVLMCADPLLSEDVTKLEQSAKIMLASDAKTFVTYHEGVYVRREG